MFLKVEILHVGLPVFSGVNARNDHAYLCPHMVSKITAIAANWGTNSKAGTQNHESRPVSYGQPGDLSSAVTGWQSNPAATPHV